MWGQERGRFAEAVPSALHYSLCSLTASSFMSDYSTRFKLAPTEGKQELAVMCSCRDPEENGCKGSLGCLEAFQTCPFSVPALPVPCLSSWSRDKAQLPLAEVPDTALYPLPKFPLCSPYQDWHPILGITPQACTCSFASPEGPDNFCPAQCEGFTMGGRYTSSTQLLLPWRLVQAWSWLISNFPSFFFGIKKLQPL